MGSNSGGLGKLRSVNLNAYLLIGVAGTLYQGQQQSKHYKHLHMFSHYLASQSGLLQMAQGFAVCTYPLLILPRKLTAFCCVVQNDFFSQSDRDTKGIGRASKPSSHVSYAQLSRLVKNTMPARWDKWY